MSDPSGSPEARPGTSTVGKRPWLGKLSICLASFAVGAVVNDLGGPLGYRGLAGAIALLAVVTAATWTHGLNPDARLPRYAPRLFLVPAAVTAAVAAFSPGATGGTFTVIAAILTIGAVLAAKELEFAPRLLVGPVLIASGPRFIALGATLMANGGPLMGAAFIAVGPGCIAFGAALIANSGRLAGATSIAVGAAVTALGAASIVTGAEDVAANRATGGGVALIVLGAAVIAVWPAVIGPRTIANRTRQAIGWAAKAPQATRDPDTQASAGSNAE